MASERDRAQAQIRGTASQALLNTQTQGIPLSEPLVDNTKLGSFWVRVGVSIPVNGISIPVNTGGRIPSAFIVVDNNTNAVIYRTAADKALASPNKIIFPARFPACL